MDTDLSCCYLDFRNQNKMNLSIWMRHVFLSWVLPTPYYSVIYFEKTKRVRGHEKRNLDKPYNT